MEMPRTGMKPIGAFIAERTIFLRGADALSAKGFTQVPNHTLESKRLSAGAKLTFAMLLKYAWQNDFCFPGQDRLADDMGVSRASANTYVKELQREQFIAITRRGQGRTNLYELNLALAGGEGSRLRKSKS